jgi:signal transduction histidine kinase
MLTLKNNLVFVGVLVALAFCSNAQEPADSLLSVLAKTKNDTTYVDILNKLSKNYRYSQPTEAIDFAVKAEKIAQNCNYQEGLAMAYHNLGALYADKERNELALEYYSKSIKIQRVFNNQQALAHLYDNIGLIYRRQLKYDQALDYHNQSLAIKKHLNDTMGIAYSYGNIGLIFSEQAKYDKALIHFYNSLRLKEALNDKYGMANSYGNIGVIYLKIKSYDQAQINLERSLALFVETYNKTGIAESQLYLSEIYTHQDLLVKAIDALNICIEIYQEKGNMKGLADSYLKLGQVYVKKRQGHTAHDYFLKSLDLYKKNQYEKGEVEARLALADYYYKQGDFETSKMQLNTLLALAEKNQFDDLQLDALKLLVKIYYYEESYQKTTSLLSKAIDLTDSLNKQNLAKEVAQIQMQNEFDKKLLQNEFESRRVKFANEQRIKRYNLARNILIGSTVLLFVLLLIIFRKTKKQTRQNKKLIEQQTLIAEQVKVLEQQKHELVHANETKNKFLTIIGHDLRNPFNAINSFVSLVTDNPDAIDELTLKKYLFLIKDAGANAQSLLENLLEWAKNQSGELVAKKEKVSLNYIIRGNILLIKEVASQKGIQIIEELADGNPLVIVDKNMINTVLRNLLSNAIKFNKSQGTVWINTTIQNDEVKVLIRDTGTGMTNEQIKHVFETHSLPGGMEELGSSGLGLTLCKDFLQKHKQELRVESIANEGSSFWFYLPITH